MDYGQKFAANGVFGIASDGLADPIHLRPGTVTATAFGYLAGTTSNIQSQINAVVAGTSFRGGYDASSNLFPSTGGSGGGGAIKAGDNWAITVPGTLGGTPVIIGTQIIALVNTPGQTAGNWNVPTNQVTSVFGRMGAVIAQTGDYTIAQVTNGLSNVLNSANIFVGNGSNLAIGISLTGEGSLSNTGALTLANAAVIGKILTGLSITNSAIIATDSLLIALGKAQGQINSISSSSITSVFGRLGPTITAQSGDYSVAQVTGAAPLASPALTGSPTAPTKTQGDNSTNIATTAYVDTGLALKSNLASPTFTGVPAAPTAAPGTNTTQLATTAFVAAAAAAGVTSFNTRTGAVVPAPGDYTIAQVTNGLSNVLTSADIFVGNVSNVAIAVSPSGELSMNNAGVFTLSNSAVIGKLLTGLSPTLGTISATDTILQAFNKTAFYLSNSVTSFNTRIGAVVPTTGDYSVAQVTGAAPLASPALTGSPTAPTKTQGDNSTNIATTAYVDTGLALKSNLASPTFTGVPAAPTAAPGTNTTQLATTAFATTALALKANLASPTFTGVPAAPTASPGTNTTQLATTAFVTASAAAGTLQTAYNNSSSPAIILLSGSKNFKVQNGVGDLLDVDPISNIVTGKNLALGVYVQGGVLSTSNTGELIPSNSINNISLKSAFVTTTQTTIFAPPTLPSGIGAWSVNVSNLNAMFNFSGTMTADITTSGLNGLDTGAVAANNWYALMPIFNTTSQLAGSLYTLTPASPSYPSGYAHGRNVLWQRFTASGFLKFVQIGNGATKRIFYTDTLASTSVLTNGASTSFASVSLSSFLPAGVQSGIMSYTYVTVVGAGFLIREAGSTVTTPIINIDPGIASTTKGTFPFVCNSSQAIEYRNISNADTLSLSVLSYDYDV